MNRVSVYLVLGMAVGFALFASCKDKGKSPASATGTGATKSVELEIHNVPTAQKTSLGGLVVKNDPSLSAHGTYTSPPPRRSIVATCKGVDGLLTADAKVNIFAAIRGGSPIPYDGSANKVTAGSATEFWVEGTTASGSSRDVTITLTPTSSSSGSSGGGGGSGGVASDSVTFTVLWVDVSAHFSSTDHISADNAGRPQYVAQASSDALGGPQLYSLRTGPERFGFGVEYRGAVHPSDFKPSEFGAYTILGRDGDSRTYNDGTGPVGNGQNPERVDHFNAKIPEGSDWDFTNGYASNGIRDDDPQSGGSHGVLYDWDDAGVSCVGGPPVGTVRRQRFNVHEFASLKPAYGDPVLCSNVYECYIALSMQHSAAGDANWVPYVQPGVSGDNVMNTGQLPNLTWDLKP